MFTIMSPTPIFSLAFDAPASAPSPFFRPPVPSPLSSSSIRASSASPPSALATRDQNTLPRIPETQSSPISAKQQFKYATRNPRSNPIIKKREEAQESRRRLFLQNVRQRADDRKWEQRGGENEILKLEWTRLNRELQQAKESAADCFIREEEIDDEPVPELDDADSMMLDEIIREEEAEIDALLSALPIETEQSDEKAPGSSQFSDDEYDDLFMEYLSSEVEGSQMVLSQDVDMF
ncbi:hypothetical protein QBC47DRAFT_367668 [Echria macrotheca]|uniref:Uncharacterized protein n=1 Tax=Echria macrotheca TaxID=438768 RepID=A0AAJ0BPH1_9PEZI|nr:hypothetical protein QBC47DRAFT_367668 [Echria macrotheca]